MYNALEAGLLSANGINTWMPIATAANVAQGAAALALALKTKNNKTKALALPASLSAFLGITEPAIFGVNIRYMKPFIAGCIGGACGALVAGVTGIGASAYGITGLFGFLITTDYTISYLIVMVVAAAVAFAISWFLFKEEPVSNNISTEAVKKDTKEIDTEKNTVYAPVEGKAIALTEVKDDTFAGEILGKGMAIIPKDEKVVAPFDGTISTLFDTKHAVGITSEDGLEILIHVGINTVELKGKCYEAHVKEGDTVKAGDILLTVDLEGIKSAGYDTTTPVIITNSDDYTSVEVLKTGEVHKLDAVLKAN